MTLKMPKTTSNGSSTSPALTWIRSTTNADNRAMKAMLMGRRSQNKVSFVGA